MPVRSSDDGNVEQDAPQTLIGWQGVRFLLPPEWNLTGFSLDRSNGYLKVDSPGSMFAQVKWTDPKYTQSRSVAEWAWRSWKTYRGGGVAAGGDPDLKQTLDAFLKDTAKAARKSRSEFECKVKPESEELGGQRMAHNFSWTGNGQGQGKIWYCRECKRVVIAQVVGTARDPVPAVASVMFSEMRDHGEDGWETWALFDLVIGVPSNFSLKAQKLMSGYLRLEFQRIGGEKLVVERWGLADVALRRFSLGEWFEKTCPVRQHAGRVAESEVNGHKAVMTSGSVKSPSAWARALAEGAATKNPALHYEAAAWSCPEANRIYAVQVWRGKQTVGLIDEVVARCECH